MNYIDEFDLIGNHEDTSEDENKSTLIGLFEIDFKRSIQVSEFEYKNEKYIKISRVSSKKTKSFTINKKYLKNLKDVFDKVE